MVYSFRVAAMAVIMTLGATAAAAADPIEGRWRTEPGSIAQIAACGSQFCIRLVSGQHSGKQIGRMSPAGTGSYEGSITDPADDRTYRGSATLSGDQLRLRRCVLVFCRTQNWSRE